MADPKINLLIVDDETRFLVSMTKRLQQRGFDVIAVDCGEKALEAAQRARVDIALVDLKMPGISGEETLEALKKEHEGLEVIILTGHGSMNLAEECSRGGAYSCLQKPCDFDELLRELAFAYKKRMMNRLGWGAAEMDARLGPVEEEKPLELLRRLKALGSAGR